MRISDWSSDVCSSDLVSADPRDVDLRGQGAHEGIGPTAEVGHHRGRDAEDLSDQGDRQGDGQLLGEVGRAIVPDALDELVDQGRGRSEEHTSELQSLMRISYAVFCLKKQNYTYEPK